MSKHPNKKLENAWAMYDWANSAFQSTVITAVFPPFFASVAAAGLPPAVATARFASNWELSVLRATAVLRELAKLGVPESRLRAVGYADTRPLTLDSESRALNRRVGILLVL